jgi:hypothetical protein
MPAIFNVPIKTAGVTKKNAPRPIKSIPAHDIAAAAIRYAIMVMVLSPAGSLD